ncbi:MAG: TolC family protein [Saprospiraceae bacterium]|nr:TolC family protein [Saprospiraceae bacterium]
MKRIRLLTVLALSGLSLGLFGQSAPWTLEKCVNYAVQNSLRVKQSQALIRDGELAVKQGQMSRLPSLNASTSAGAQFGRTIDPFTNTFATSSIKFNSFGLSAGMPLYTGGRISAGIHQSKLELEARAYDLQNVSNTLALDVARSYLTILLAQEQLDNAERQLNLSRQQLDQTDKLIRAGALPPNDRLDVLAQIARNEQVVVEVRNAVRSAYLGLRQLMELPPDEDLVIARPEITVPEVIDQATLSFPAVYASALSNQPQIKSGDLRLKAAADGITLARSGMLPTLSIGGNLNTAFSSVARQVDGFQTIRQSQTVFIDGQPILFETDVLSPIFMDIPYFNQLNNNFGQSIGLTLSVPIYNNHRNNIAVERARLGVLNQELQNRQQRQLLQTVVQQAINDAMAAREAWMAGNKAVEAAQAAFDNAQKRFDLGAINALQYSTARITLDSAQVDLIRAKYQYLFNLKNVEFYLGKPMQLN